MSYIIILIMAAFLDYIIGDPWGWPHPVRVMGWFISRWTQFSWQHFSRPLSQRLAGIGLALTTIGTAAVSGWLIVHITHWLHPWLGITVASILLASCFALHSLTKAALDVIKPLNDGQLSQARQILSQYVGRDTADLSESEILRAVLETVTENATDGVMAPLFYAIIGILIPSIGPIPLALGYKASSTLDSMVGYREPPYTYIGWFSAKLEDFLTWVPCRLTVITLAILSLKPLRVWHLCRRDAIQDPSPNSGWSECAYAAILGVQMGGLNWYKGVAKYKPLLGDPIYPITSTSIYRALQLTRYSFLLWLGLTTVAYKIITTYYIDYHVH
ncbi:MAG: cobalamin biosynthesis protein [Cylindrospermopsis raciborskii KL1]|uniref:adenosylcobinamide-phosphate synthase CbiB n=1 Tax=Cylindrospermopsis raciborskii TaxID=77022 RepID=UPI001A235BEA|nr:adenosylcobinamide-phosphate synthase CbiB [Cylindrospermopsis raciborskii]MBG0743308.1 cobalamin biosynthesis protein [Cylindrospermopsis raciborskii KL1]